MEEKATDRNWKQRDSTKVSAMRKSRDGPVIRTLHCHGLGFNPWSGTKIPQHTHSVAIKTVSAKKEFTPLRAK